MKSVTLIGAGLAALLLALPGMSQAAEKEKSMGRTEMKECESMKGEEGHWTAKHLDLTEEQQEKIKAIKAEHKETIKPLFEKMKAQMKELEDLVNKKAADRELERALDRIKDTREDIESAMAKFKKKHDAVLTPLQKAKFALGAKKASKEKPKEKSKTKSKKTM